MINPLFTDRKGLREVVIESKVAFAMRQGNRAALRTGTVTALLPNGYATILSDKNHDCHRSCKDLVVFA